MRITRSFDFTWWNGHFIFLLSILYQSYMKIQCWVVLVAVISVTRNDKKVEFYRVLGIKTGIT